MEAMGGLLMMIIWLTLFIFWAWALIDILKSDFKESINKLIWLLVVCFFYVLGALLYYFIGRGQKA
jgi:ABC-type molybdate transport system permease subunit